jgi:potassium-transporting ATPase KdpC subunit
MISHLRANLVLVVATFFLCSVAYPLVVWGVAYAAFRSNAAGGLVTVADQQAPVGALLIAQEFKGAEYFQPRPSTTTGKAYNAAFSGASNLGSNNPKLRDRVARQLGPIVNYRKNYHNGGPVGPDVQKWFEEKPERLAEWATTYSTPANAWINSDKPTTDAVAAWVEAHDKAVAAWKEKHTDASDDQAFFAVFAEQHPGKVPSLDKDKIVPSDSAEDVQGWFFDMWLQAHPDEAGNIEPVPADMVTVSGSGLDPHITLRSAKAQLNRVVKGWKAKDVKVDETTLRQKIELLLESKASAPLLGFGGEPLVNVLELNLELRKQFGSGK